MRQDADKMVVARQREFTDNQVLNRFRNDVKSQFGEDGIIEAIFKIIPQDVQNKWCCEFGAWDGMHCSNTYNLVVNKGWTGIFIEANKKKFVDLQRTYKNFDKTILLNEFVNISGNNTLDSLLKGAGAPVDLDFLSIDVDSIDYHLWESVVEYRPKLVVIEFNPTIPNNIEYVQAADPSKKHGTSILSMTKLAKSKGYELICINAENAFYVDQKYFKFFGIENNSIDELKYYREPLQVFQLFDGTLVFQGEAPQLLIWYSLPVNFNKLQILPKFIRHLNAPWGGGLLGTLVRASIKFLRQSRFKNWKGYDIDPGAWKM
jgi:hypothetical protein